jgi:alpha-beta hydrolase superfamily lysophospholipase
MSGASETTFRLSCADALPWANASLQLFVYRWAPQSSAPKAVVLIAHGMAEHAARYARFAQELCAAGYVVYAADHRGHGQTVERADLGWFEGGLAAVIADQERLRLRASGEYPGLPVFVIGHSMGSFVVRRYLCAYGHEIAGAVLSGTAGGKIGLVKAAKVLAFLESLRVGQRGKSPVLHATTFGEYNKRFKPARTDADWLSRDPAEVDKYVADPLCGFEVTTTAWREVMLSVIEMQDPANLARMPKELPLFLLSGSVDPVGGSAGVLASVELFKASGLTDVTHKLYEGGRHEMLNETNRDEVQRDIVAWLDGVLAKRGAGLAQARKSA